MHHARQLRDLILYCFFSSGAGDFVDFHSNQVTKPSPIEQMSMVRHSKAALAKSENESVESNMAILV